MDLFHGNALYEVDLWVVYSVNKGIHYIFVTVVDMNGRKGNNHWKKLFQIFAS